ncbi:GMC family oxidoreductase N-terminal domain-containing protein [Pseudonocardia yunnanensis]|uniref:GMC family oxidoreductase n=1 Tax=Pseudonocardia yunnanensis TaxID=58107 RepID=A0ABW4F8M2_9PSEU
MPEKNDAQTVDVVIVGGGSAGAVLANRLSADPARTVVLVEGGPAYAVDEYPAVLRDPARVGDDAEHDWGLTATIDDTGRVIPTPRGKVLGGSSAVNAAVALRARADDFEKWATHGVTGWSFEEVLETYRALENTTDGDPRLRGRSGPFPIRQRTCAELTPSLRAFVDASVAQGFARLDDPNGTQQNGVTPYPLNVVNEVRQNTGLVYLTAEVRRRPNLTIRDRTTVDSVLFDGTAATGIVTLDGQVLRAGEVILSAGTYGSAGILMRSGIGPATDLGRHGIEVVSDLPVGRRFQDHPFYYNIYTLKPDANAMSPAAGAIVWTRSSEAIGDELDLHISATHLADPSISPTGGAIVLATAVTQPDSIGSVALRSRDPQDGLAIDLNFLAEPRDRRRMLEGVQISRRIGRDSAMAAVVDGELTPGPGIRDDTALEQVIRQQLDTYQHPTSTAPMGGDGDPWAVVDSAGNVRGVSRLRVVDASIMPRVPSTAPNVTTIMLAEHIARTNMR